METAMIKVGLRIDVDTLRGTKKGVLPLLYILGERRIQASFFFSVGPDNMGRHLRRFLRPQFALKMLRSRAASLYGWDILFRGTLGEGRCIGKSCEEIIRTAAIAGHEIGLHAWDHHHWQSNIETMSADEVKRNVQQGIDEIKRITGEMPISFAAPAWRVSDVALIALEEFSFLYRSDCRGVSPFLPQLLGKGMRGRGKEKEHIAVKCFTIPQIPTTLPTYDEMVGRDCSRKEYNKKLLAYFLPDTFHVLTIHAEAEGIFCANMFAEFLDMAEAQNIVFCPLGKLLPLNKDALPFSTMESGKVDGREGLFSIQGER